MANRYLLFILFLLAGCQDVETQPPAQKKTELPEFHAETTLVSESSWPRHIRSQGSLFPDEEATLGIKVEGRVAEVNVDLGDLVKANEPLVTIYQEDFKLFVQQADAQLKQARAAVGLEPDAPLEKLQPTNSPPVREQRSLWDEAIANRKRADDLLANNAIVLAEYEQIASAEKVAAARYDAAINNVKEKIASILVQQTMLDLARENLQNTILKAPFDAVVLEKMVAPGSYVKVGDPMIKVIRVDKLRYRGNVPERLSQSLAAGQTVQLEIDSLDHPYTTQISRISPLLDQASRSLTFEAIINNQDRKLRAGLFAEANVVIEPDAKAVTIPASAVLRFAGNEKVWIVQDNVVSEKVIVLGEQREDLIRVQEGLSPGDRILLQGLSGQPGKLIEGPPPEKSETPPTTTAETQP